jgi:hypothetical protein
MIKTCFDCQFYKIIKGRGQCVFIPDFYHYHDDREWACNEFTPEYPEDFKEDREEMVLVGVKQRGVKLKWKRKKQRTYRF